MARVTKGTSDSESERVSSRRKGASAARRTKEESPEFPPASEPDADGDAEGEDEVEGEDEGEYEVEAIIDYDAKMFAGKPGYKIKWKDYNASHNSWLSEADLNAPEAIADYWKAQQTVAASKRSSSKKRASSSRASSRARASETEEESASIVKPVSSRKSSKPQSKVVEIAMDVDDEPPAKRPRNGSATNKRKSAEEEKAPRKKDYILMSKEELAMESWENYVIIETMERDNDKLTVFMSLKNTGKRTCVNIALAREKCPNALFDFYEKHLKWRSVHDLDDEDEDEDKD